MRQSREVEVSMNHRKKFSSFTLAEAYKLLNIECLEPWHFETRDWPPSDFFTIRLQRLQDNFDLRSYEKSKELLIDAYCEEAINPIASLKIWKGAAISSDRAKGNADYLIAERRDYLDRPYLCVVEAKKDDFEQGLAQCLAEMYACRWQNAAINVAIGSFGIVTNATTWQFYQLSTDGIVYESRPYTSGDPAQLLGVLNYIFTQCCP
jgi:hypothetical protein